MGVNPASAVSTNDLDGGRNNTFLTSDNIFYAYVRQGERLDVSLYNLMNGTVKETAMNTPGVAEVTVKDPNGVAYRCTASSWLRTEEVDFPVTDRNVGEGCSIPTLSGVEGLWRVDIVTSGGWGPSYRTDIRITKDGTYMPGRIFSNRLSMAQQSLVEGKNGWVVAPPSDLTFYSIDPTGYQYQINLNQYQGMWSRFIVNNVGIPNNTTSCQPTYRSWTAQLPEVSDLTGVVSPCGEFHLFFEPIDQTMPAHAKSVDGDMYLRPSLPVTNISFARTSPTSSAGTFAIRVTNQALTGTYDLLIDANGDGDYTDAVDRTIPVTFPGGPANANVTVPFDGKDGKGNKIPLVQTFSGHIEFSKTGEFHMVLADVEHFAGGLTMIKRNGPQAGDTTVHWDDSHLPDNTCGNEISAACQGNRPNPIKTGPAGVDSSRGVHTWDNGGPGEFFSWGDGRWIDTWAYTAGIYGRATVKVPGVGLEVSKKVLSDPKQVLPGDKVYYEATIKNVGDADYSEENPVVGVDDLTDVLDDATYNNDATATRGDLTVTDKKMTWRGTLPAGASVKIRYSVTIKPTAEQGNHKLSNAIFLEKDPPPACAPDDPTCAQTETGLPAITIVKSSTTTLVSQVGQQIPYSFKVTNTGMEPLTDVRVTDPRIPSLSCGPFSLAVGESKDCSGTYYATAADLDSSRLSNTATVTGKNHAGATVSDKSKADIPVRGASSIGLVKSSMTPSFTHAGQQVTYKFEVKNTGSLPLSNVTVRDTSLPGIALFGCGPWKLAAGETASCTGTYTVTEADMGKAVISNTATATGTTQDNDQVTAQSTADVPMAIQTMPGIGLVKKASPATVTAAGQRVTFTFIVTNTGGTQLSAVSVADNDLPGIEMHGCENLGTLRPGDIVTCTGSYVVTQADIDRGGFENTATATGAPPAGPVVTADASATVTAQRTSSIRLSKTSASRVTAANQQVVYTFRVTNTGTTTLTDVSVTDTDLPGLKLSGCKFNTLAPGQSATCTGRYTTTQADVDAGQIANHASVSGTDPSKTVVTDDDTFVLPIGGHGGLSVEKTANVSSVTGPNQQVIYTFLVRNTGAAALKDVKVTDVSLPGLDMSACSWASLPANSHRTCTATYTTTQADIDRGSLVNTATATGVEESTGTQLEDTDTVTIPVSQNESIRLVKTAAPATVSKENDTVTYTFTVTNTGNVTLNNVTVSDTDLPGLNPATCALGSLSVGQQKSCTATYRVTQADIDRGHIVNVAKAQGTKPDGSVVSDTAQATVNAAANPAVTIEKTSASAPEKAGDQVAYTFKVTNTGNVALTNVSVTDPMTAKGLTLFGCSWASLAVGHSVTCTGTYTLTQKDADAGSITNTATVKGQTPSGSQVSDDDSTTVAWGDNGAIDIDKQMLSRPAAPVKAGDRIGYQFTVTNKGPVNLSNVSVADQLPGVTLSGCGPWTLAPGASRSCTGIYTLTQADVDKLASIGAGVSVQPGVFSGVINNAATATGTTPGGKQVTGSDREQVGLTPGSGIGVVKSSAVDVVTAVGQTIPFTFTVTNTGTTTLSDVSVRDSLPGVTMSGCSWKTLAPGAKVTCTGTYTVTADDLNAGMVVNTATATGTAPDGPVTGENTVMIPTLSQPGLRVVKKATVTDAGGATVPQVSSTHDTVTYTFQVTNTGNVAVAAIRVVDVFSVGDADRLSPVTCAATSLEPGQSITCTATYRVAQADLDAGVISNTAVASGVGTSGESVTSPPSMAEVPANQAGGISLAKTANKNTITQAGEQVVYTFTVTNTGPATLHDVTVADPMPGLKLLNCSLGTMAAGEKKTCTGTYTITQADIDRGEVNNTATASGTTPKGDKVSASDQWSIGTTPAPGITVKKTAATIQATAAGQSVSYTFQVANSGNTTLKNVTVNDPMFGGQVAGCGPWTLNPGESKNCTATHRVTQADIDRGVIHNQATATGTPPTGKPVTDTDTVDVPALQRNSVEIEKTSTTTQITHVGQSVPFEFRVTNSGNTTLTQVIVSDPMLGGQVAGCGPWELAPGQVRTCQATHRVTQADLDAGGLTNTATVSGKKPDGKDAPTDSSTVTIPAGSDRGAISVNKTAKTAVVTAAGQKITFDFQIRNTGPVTLTNVRLNDALPGMDMSACGPWATLASGQTVTCSGTYTVTQADMDAGQVRNAATVTGTQPDGKTVTGEDSTTVTTDNAARISVVKTANTATITGAGQKITYTFVVTNTGKVNLTDVRLADSLTGVTLTDCGPWPVLAPGASKTCTGTYTVTQADMDAGSVHNLATVTGGKPGGGTTTGTDETTTVTTPNLGGIKIVKFTTSQVSKNGDPVTYTFEVTNTGKVTLSNVAVTDPLKGVVLEGCSWASLAPGQTVRCTGTYVATQADVNAGRIANTATATGTTPDGVTVNDTDTAVIRTDGTGSLKIVKSSTTTLVTAAGQKVPYSFTVINTGTTTLRDVSVTDSLPGVKLSGCSWATLEAGKSGTCHGTYTATADDMKAGRITNTATASGKDPGGATVKDHDQVTIPTNSGPEIPVDQTGGMKLEKTADKSVVTKAGEQVVYTFVVTNTGKVALSNVSVSDPLPGLKLNGCAWETLAVGASKTCTGTYTVTQEDIDRGGVKNVARVVGKTPDGSTTGGEGSWEITSPRTPAISVSKTASTGQVTAAGSRVTYRFTVVNEGNVTLTGVTVTDAKLGGAITGCGPWTLAPGASKTCSATYTVTQAEMDAGIVHNEAVATGRPPTGDTVTANDTADVTAVGKALVSIDKTSSTTQVTHAGQRIVYLFRVTNTGTVTLNGVTVTDPMFGGHVAGCGPWTLAPGETRTCQATHEVTQAEFDAGGVLKNTATVTGQTPGGGGTPGGEVPPTTDEVKIPVGPGVGAISVKKSASTALVTAVGQKVTYRFEIRNTGPVALSNVTITDALSGVDMSGCGPWSTLKPGDVVNCSADYTVTQADMDAGRIANAATVAGTQPDGKQVDDRDSVTTPTDNVASLGVKKTADTTTITGVGQKITYTFVVTNTGKVTLHDVTLKDSLNNVVLNNCGPWKTLAVGASVTCTGTYTVTQEDVDSGSVRNLVTVTGEKPGEPEVPGGEKPGGGGTPGTGTPGPEKPGGGGTPGTGTPSTGTPGGGGTPGTGKPGTGGGTDQVTGTDKETVVTGPNTGGLKIVKSASGQVKSAGDLVTYTFEVTNTGRVTLHDVTVTDPMTDRGLVLKGCAWKTLAPGQTVTCTGTYAVSADDLKAGQVSNTATGSGTTPDGTTVHDRDTVTIATGGGGSAGGSGAIDLVKKVTTGPVSKPGQQVGYEFTVTNTGTAVLSHVRISDALPGISLSGCEWKSLKPGESKTCTGTYTVKQADIDAGVIYNQASVTGQTPGGGSPETTDRVTVNPVQTPRLTIVKSSKTQLITKVGQKVVYDFRVTNDGNVTLTGVKVTDPLPGIVLDCDTWTLAPGESKTCHGTYTVKQADMDAGKVVNTASVTGQPPGGNLVTGEGTTTTNVRQSPALRIVKTAKVYGADGREITKIAAPGDRVVYFFTVTNVGDVTAHNVTVDDRLQVGQSSQLTPVDYQGKSRVLKPGEQQTYTANYVVSQADLDAGWVVNVATVTGGLPGGGPGPGTFPAGPPSKVVIPGQKVVKPPVVKPPVIEPPVIEPPVGPPTAGPSKPPTVGPSKPPVIDPSKPPVVQPPRPPKVVTGGTVVGWRGVATPPRPHRGTDVREVAAVSPTARTWPRRSARRRLAN